MDFIFIFSDESGRPDLGVCQQHDWKTFTACLISEIFFDAEKKKEILFFCSFENGGCEIDPCTMIILYRNSRDLWKFMKDDANFDEKIWTLKKKSVQTKKKFLGSSSTFFFLPTVSFLPLYLPSLSFCCDRKKRIFSMNGKKEYFFSPPKWRKSSKKCVICAIWQKYIVLKNLILFLNFRT